MGGDGAAGVAAVSEDELLKLAEEYARYAAEHEGDRVTSRLIDEYDARGAAIARVRAQHVAFSAGYCQECAKDWPCPTITALE